MTDQVLKKLEDQLQCSICLDTYKEPKLLQCFHIYCKDCLVKVVVKDLQGTLSISCPTCRQDMTVPSKGVSGLQPAFHINHLLEIRDDLKRVEPSSSCSQKSGEEEGKDICQPKKKNFTLYCSHHETKEMELFCETCDELICLKCAIKGSNHHSHNYSALSEVFEKCKTNIAALLEPVEQRVHVIKKALDHIEERSNEISSQRDVLESTIHDRVAKIHALVDARKKELVNNLQKISEDKLALLNSQRGGLEASCTQLSSCLEFVKAGLDTGTPLETLQMKTTVSSLIKDLMSSFGVDICEPVTEADMRFSEPHDAQNDEYKGYGNVYAFGSCEVTKSHATGSGLSSAMVGKEATVVFHAVNHLGAACAEPIKNLRCELVSDINGTKVRGFVERIGKGGKNQLSYRPAIQGRHQLHIVINNQPILGSPFSVLVELEVQKLTSSVLIMKGVTSPWGLAVSEKEGEVVVSDSDRQCISIFSRSLGGILRSFGKLGSCHGQFKSPRGISLDRSSNVFVVDSENHRIQKFTLDGKFISSVGSMGSGPLQFYFPKDIVYNFANDRIYITDGNDQIQVLNSDLSLRGIFGKHGKGKGQFDNPWGIACDINGHVYVADTYNHRVQVFTADKEFVTMFGTRGKEDGQLIDPISIAVDSSKAVVYVCERQNERVSIFSTSGKFIASSTGGGHKCGLAVDSDGLVYVCNVSKGQIQVY